MVLMRQKCDGNMGRAELGETLVGDMMSPLFHCFHQWPPREAPEKVKSKKLLFNPFSIWIHM